MLVYCGNIGEPVRTIEFEPLEIPAEPPMIVPPAPVPAEPVKSPEKEPVPA